MGRLADEQRARQGRRDMMFAQRFVIHGNASRAARECGAGEKSANTRGWELLQRDDVQAEIARLRAEIATRNAVEADWVVQQLRDNVLAARDANDFAAVKGSLDSLAKILGLFVDKVEQKVTHGGVLAVPVAPDAVQWAATAQAQQSLASHRQATIPGPM